MPLGSWGACVSEIERLVCIICVSIGDAGWPNSRLPHLSRMHCTRHNNGY